MSPANFSVRRRSKRRFLAPIIIGLLVVAAVLVYIGSRGGTEGPKAQKSPDAPITFSFGSLPFKPVFQGGRPSPKVIDTERRSVESLFTNYYLKTFVDPSGWSDPGFAAQSALFTPDAKAAFAKDVAALTIGPGTTDVKKVTPTKTSLTTSVYFDNGKPTYAVAVVVFNAKGETKAGVPLDIAHSATYRLQKSGNSWLVFSYEAKASQDTPPSPSPSLSPSGSPS
jgi:hypothetical protein